VTKWAPNISLLLHSEVRCLSQRKVLTRLFELQNEAQLLLTERKHELSTNLTDPDWLTRWLPAYGIFVLRFRPKKQQFSVALPMP